MPSWNQVRDLERLRLLLRDRRDSLLADRRERCGDLGGGGGGERREKAISLACDNYLTCINT